MLTAKRILSKLNEQDDYETWLKKVDDYTTKKVGYLIDFDWKDSYDSGESPAVAATTAIKKTKSKSVL